MQHTTKLVFFVFFCLIASSLSKQLQVEQNFMNTTFNSTEGWTVLNSQNPATTKTLCGKYSIFGGMFEFGHQASITKNFIGLAPHYSMNLQFTYYKIGTWDTETFYVFADGVLLYSHVAGFEGNEYCTTDHTVYTDFQKMDVAVSFPHNSANVVIMMTSNLDEEGWNESWGISDLVLTSEGCPDGCDTCTSSDKSLCAGFTLLSQNWVGQTIIQEGWQVNGGKAASTSCGGVQIFGGAGVLGSKSTIQNNVTEIPPHKQIWLKLQFWALNTWDKEVPTITVDGVVVWTVDPKLKSGWPQFVCTTTTSSQQNKLFDVSVVIDHSATAARIVVSTGSDQSNNDASWGVRNFQLYSKNLGVGFVQVDEDFVGQTVVTSEGWDVQGNIGLKSSCGGVEIFGGQGVFGGGAIVQKTFTNLPPHHSVRVTFELHKIGAWDNSKFIEYADGVEIINDLTTTASIKTCGTTTVRDEVNYYDKTFYHSISDVSIALASNLPVSSKNGYWGIKNFKIYVVPCPSNCRVCDAGTLDTCTQWQQFASEFTDDQNFGNVGWLASGGSATARNSICGGAQLFGGFNNFGSKAQITKLFSNLPAHAYMRIQFQFWKIDTWDDGEQGVMKVDGAVVWSKHVDFYDAYLACGAQAYQDRPYDVDITFNHTSPVASVLITSNLDELSDNESWGIRNFRIFLSTGKQQADDVSMTDSQWLYTAWAGNQFTDIEGWSVQQSYSSPLITSCNEQKMVGGQNVLGGQSSVVKRISLVPHYKMRIRASLFKVGVWTNEKFMVFVDGVNVYDDTLTTLQEVQQCATQKSSQYILDVTFLHTNIDAVVVITSNLNGKADTQSWGVRNFRIGLMRCPVDCEACTVGTLEVCQKWKVVSTQFNQTSINSADGWTVSGALATSSLCAGIPLVGGYGVFGSGAQISRKFNNLPAHNTLRFRFQFWKLDKWDNEQAKIFADNALIWYSDFSQTQTMPAKICGNTSNFVGSIIDVELQFYHYGASVEFVVSSNLTKSQNNFTQKSWGIRDIVLISVDSTGLQDQSSNDPNIYYRSFQGNEFNSLDGWSIVSGNGNSSFSTCGRTKFLGGFNILKAGSSLVKQISLPPHSDVTLRFQLTQIEFKAGDVFGLFIDGVNVQNYQIQTSQASGMCQTSSSTKDQHMSQETFINVKVPHNNPTITIVMTNLADRNSTSDSSWGIRNFQLLFTSCPNNCAVCSTDATKNDRCSLLQVVSTDFINPSQINLNGWITKPASAKFTYCSGVRLLGGLQQFLGGAEISKSYILPAHNKLIVSLQLWKMGVWGDNKVGKPDAQYGQIYIDDVLVWSSALNQNNQTQTLPNSICGEKQYPAGEQIFDVYIVLEHTKPNATLRITSTLVQGGVSQNSWGVRDIQIITQRGQGILTSQVSTPVYSTFTDNAFTTQGSWTAVNVKDPKNVFNTCGSAKFFGGNGVFVGNSAAVLYQDLKPHYTVSIKFTLFQLGTWTGERFLVYVDGALLSESANVYPVENGQSSCTIGNTQVNQQSYQYFITQIPHNAPNIEVILTSTLKSATDQPSWGFRDFYLSIDQCPDSCLMCSHSTLNNCDNLNLISQSWVDNTPQVADGWQVTGNTNGVSSNCAGINVFGGPTVFSQKSTIIKTFTNLPVHNNVGVKFQIWKVGQWDASNIQLLIDGVLFKIDNKEFGTGFKASVCGNKNDAFLEFTLNKYLSTDHVNSAVTFQFQASGYTDANCFWAIRNFQLFHEQSAFTQRPFGFFISQYGNNFNTTEGWVIQNQNTQVNQIFTVCGRKRYFGGKGLFDKRAAITQQLILPPHYQVDISFNILKVNFKKDSAFYVIVDGVQLYSEQLSLESYMQQCSSDNNGVLAEVVNVVVSVQHNFPSVTVVIMTNLDQTTNDASWGIRDFVLNYKACPANCLTCTSTTLKEELCGVWSQVDSSLTQLTATNFNVTNWKVFQDNVLISTASSVSTCGAVQLLGGYNKFGRGAAVERFVNKLPVHSNIKVKLQLWKIDSWDDEFIYVTVDGQLMYTKSFKIVEGLSVNYCGEGYHTNWGLFAERALDIEFSLNHVSENMTIRITSNINQPADDESWGVRDVIVYANNQSAFYVSQQNTTFTSSEGWVIAGSQSKEITTLCGANKVLGGKGILGKDALLSKIVVLPPHYQVDISFNVLKTNFRSDQVVIVYIDGEKIDNSLINVPGVASQCSSTYVNVVVSVLHNAPTLNIIITSSLDQNANDASWGIRDFILNIKACPSKCQTCAMNARSEAVCSVWTIVDSSLTQLDSASFSLAGWQYLQDNVPVPVDGTKVTSCSGVVMLGGFNKFGAGAVALRTVTKLAPHNNMKIKLTLWKIDSFDNEQIQVYVDGKLLWSRAFQIDEGINGNICGYPNIPWWGDEPIDLELTFRHTSENATLKITSTLNQLPNDESWGVRDVIIFTELTNDSTPISDGLILQYESFKTNSITESSDWKISGTVPNQLVSACGDDRIYGGLGVFDSTNTAFLFLDDLPPHSEIQIRFRLYLVNSWLNNKFFVTVDGVQQFKTELAQSLGEQLCDDDQGTYQQLYDVVITIPHTAISTFIELSSDLDGKDDSLSWGIKRFEILYNPCPIGCVTCNKHDKNSNDCSEWEVSGASFIDNPLTITQNPMYEGWTSSDLKSLTNYRNCSGVSLYGSLNPTTLSKQNFKTFDKLPAHNVLKLQLQLWEFETQNSQAFSVYVDEKLVWQNTVKKVQAKNITVAQACGPTKQIFDIDVTISHLLNTANIQISTNVSSWAIRDVVVFVQQVPDTQVASTDLYSAFSTQSFNTADGWLVNQAYSQSVTSQCGTDKLLGGYGVMGKNSNLVKFLTLPPHYQIRIQFELYKINSWDAEQFFLYVDGQQVFNQQLSVARGAQSCGSLEENEVIVTIDQLIQHNSPNVVIAMTTNLQGLANDKSWGIRDFQLNITPCPSGCTSCTKSTVDSCQLWSLKSSSWSGVSGLTNDGWASTGTASNADGTKGITTCSGIPLFGGYGFFGTKSAISKSFALPQHNRMYVQFQLWVVDSWKGESVSLIVDGVQYWSQSFTLSPLTPSICGTQQGATNEQLVDVSVAFDHFRINPVIQINTTLGQASNVASWGIRNFFLFTQTDLASTVSTPDSNSTYSSFFGNQFTDSNGWLIIQKYPNQPVPQNDNPFTVCSGTRLFGGYNILGAGDVVTNQIYLPPHKQIIIQIKLWKIDSQDSSQFHLAAHGRDLIPITHIAKLEEKSCGSGSNLYDVEDYYQYTLDHNSPTISFAMTTTSTVQANVQSWGFREFQITIVPCDAGCYTCSVNDKSTCLIWKPFFSSWLKSTGLSNEGWQTLGTSSIEATTCGSTQIFGGFNQLGKDMVLNKALVGLPPHSQVDFLFKIFKIDSWNGERLSFYVDGVEVWGQNFVPQTAIIRDFCGTSTSNQLDQIVNVQFTIPHKSYTMVMQFKSTLYNAPSVQSWGVRDFQMFTDIVENPVDPNKPVYEAYTNATITSTDDWIFIENNIPAGQTAKDLPTTTCGKDVMVGGYNLFGGGAMAVKKIELQPHYSITVQFELFKINQWNNDQFLLYIDGQQAYSQFFAYSEGVQLCGSGTTQYNEIKELITVTVKHNTPSVNIILTSSLSLTADKAAWGFRNFIVIVKPCPTGCVVCDDNQAHSCSMWGNLAKSWTTPDFGADGWNITQSYQQNEQNENSCAGSRILGGYQTFATGTFIKKYFFKLPPHNKIRIQMQFWAIDSWDDERASLIADTREIWGQNFVIAGNTGSFIKQLCGAPWWRDDIVDIDVSMVHTSENLTLEVRTSLDQDGSDESWGVRQFYIYLGNCAPGCLDCKGILKQDCTVSTDVSLFYSAFFNDFPLSDLSGWKATNIQPANASLVSQCGTNKLFGGFNLFGKSVSVVKMIPLPPHYLVRVKFNLMKIDSWDNQLVAVYIDGRDSYLKRFEAGVGSQMCGGSSPTEEYVDVDLARRHTASSVLVVVQSDTNQLASTGSWGINNFQVFISACPSGCIVCYSSDPILCQMWKNVEQQWSANDAIKLNGWAVTNAYSEALGNTCAGVPMLGGAGILGQKTVISKQLTNLVPHDMIKFQLQFWKIDNWDTSLQYAIIKVDGNTQWANYFSYWNGYAIDICGTQQGQFTEQTYDVDFDMKHFSPNALIEITTNLDVAPNIASWGVRQLDIFEAKCNDNCANCTSTVVNACIQCRGDYLLQSGACILPQNQLKVASEFTTAKFTDLQGWTLTNTQGLPKVYDCETTSVVGGYGVLGGGSKATKTYKFGAHTSLRFKVSLWKFDSWEGEELFINIDGTIVWRKNINFQIDGQPKCGNTNFWFQEVIFDVDVTILHTSPTATITISSTLDEKADNESYGFRDISVYVISTEQCAIFYSECNYQGQSVTYCRESRNVLKQHFLPDIKSFIIPPNSVVNLYQNNEFDSQPIEITKSQACVGDTSKYSFKPRNPTRLLVAEELDSYSNNLRKQKL